MAENCEKKSEASAAAGPVAPVSVAVVSPSPAADVAPPWRSSWPRSATVRFGRHRITVFLTPAGRWAIELDDQEIAHEPFVDLSEACRSAPAIVDAHLERSRADLRDAFSPEAARPEGGAR